MWSWESVVATSGPLAPTLHLKKKKKDPAESWKEERENSSVVLYDKFYIQLFFSIVSLRHTDFREHGGGFSPAVLPTTPQTPASYRVSAESQTPTA